MLKRTSKKKEDDLNVLAASIVEKTTGAKIKEKNPAAASETGSDYRSRLEY